MISKIDQKTDWSLESNIKYAQTAERYGFEYALTQIRFMAGYGAVSRGFPLNFSNADYVIGKSTRIGIILTGNSPLYGEARCYGRATSRAMESSGSCKANC